ncbi:hypothetical protein SR882_10435 [Guyparkeria halophila]|uniref:Uncharacterized protein n=1 Tax=Guyparkeria halophila TaxID=47960 RepID=A0ABZ0YVG7_9GAMM|nr:hypothetical protein [Guyparkeria halophila]WQH16167.1 hypothetical protein SR882_10435 [Guyparkeria halophila]
MSEAIENALKVPEADTTIGEMILRASDLELGAGRIAYKFSGEDGRPVAAFVVIVGEDTQDFLTALDDEAERLECAGGTDR